MLLELVHAATERLVDAADAPERQGVDLVIIPAATFAAQASRYRLLLLRGVVIYSQKPISTV
jgi:hypothetical protein